MAITPVPVTTRKVHLYEILNRTRLESLLVVTVADSDSVLARLRREPPPEAAFWTLHDDVAVEILAQHMSEAASEEFLKMHLQHMQQRTWRFRVWRA
ncbi:MAG: hypothetical protein PHS14_20835 [Elusimicrobia bacterium]|nr:hypothetical protein [Elusimicrobiota bacterium]